MRTPRYSKKKKKKGEEAGLDEPLEDADELAGPFLPLDEPLEDDDFVF